MPNSESTALQRTKSSGRSLMEIREFEEGLIDFLGKSGLPTGGVFVDISERMNAFNNVRSVVSKLEESRRGQSVYISKFLAATASGLFDAALNYLWDETIYELRERVSQYDIRYFFDIAVGSPERRRKLQTAEDLTKITDDELIRGANEIGLVSDLGFRHLDFIRFMRNWASAAHPNQNELTGLQLISWLETCIKEVFQLPQSNVVVETKKLLHNVRNDAIDTPAATKIGKFFADLTQDQANALASGFFGIYSDPASESRVLQNVNLLSPILWPRVDEKIRKLFGTRYAQYAANHDQEPERRARQFLDAVGGAAYIPDGIREAEIETALEELLSAHRRTNNFYNEPAFARRLQELVKNGKVPTGIEERFVQSLVDVFLTNGNGQAWNAEPYYLSMIREFDANQAVLALLSVATKEVGVKRDVPPSYRTD